METGTTGQNLNGSIGGNDRIKERYLLVKKDESVQLNDRLASRLNVTKTINQHGCSVQFVLQNVTWSDEDHTYGCTAVVYVDVFREGPIRLDIQGESHFRLLFVYSLEQVNWIFFKISTFNL